ncbi:MAG TPA: hypothetical protein VHQ86_05295, partial [Candidatus Saccharimonadia bacterium]|nr:hypothetical protein [Candidatus Saccharimonadia bacterium]
METPGHNPGEQTPKDGHSSIWDALVPDRPGEAPPPPPAPEAPAESTAESEAPQFAPGDEVVYQGERWHVAEVQDGGQIVIWRQNPEGDRDSALAGAADLRKINAITGQP